MGKSDVVGLCDRFRQYVMRLWHVIRMALSALVVPTESEEALEDFMVQYETGADQAVRSWPSPALANLMSR